MQVEIRVVVAAAPGFEDAEPQAAPGLGMDSAVQIGAAVHGLAVEGHGQGIMQRRPGKCRLDRCQDLVRLERDGGAMRIRRALIVEYAGGFSRRESAPGSK